MEGGEGEGTLGLNLPFYIPPSLPRLLMSCLQVFRRHHLSHAFLQEAQTAQPAARHARPGLGDAASLQVVRHGPICLFEVWLRAAGRSATAPNMVPRFYRGSVCDELRGCIFVEHACSLSQWWVYIRLHLPAGRLFPRAGAEQTSHTTDRSMWHSYFAPPPTILYLRDRRA